MDIGQRHFVRSRVNQTLRNSRADFEKKYIFKKKNALESTIKEST